MNIYLSFTTPEFLKYFLPESLRESHVSPAADFIMSPTLYNGAALSEKSHLNAKLVENADKANDDDGGKRRKRKEKVSMEFNTKVGNARQMVDPPDGTFHYYLDPEDPSIELPPEDEAEIRLFNDDYYVNNEKRMGKEHQRNYQRI